MSTKDDTSGSLRPSLHAPQAPPQGTTACQICTPIWQNSTRRKRRTILSNALARSTPASTLCPPSPSVLRAGSNARPTIAGIEWPATTRAHRSHLHQDPFLRLHRTCSGFVVVNAGPASQTRPDRPGPALSTALLHVHVHLALLLGPTKPTFSLPS
jgi:hypothetical protein